MKRDSAPAKLAVVVGIGVILLGVGSLKARVSSRPRAPTADPPSQLAAPEGAGAPQGGAAVEVPRAAPAEATPAAPARPTQADRLALLEACTDGDLARVEVLAGRGVSLDGTLVNAARSGSAALVGWLLAHGVDVKEDEDLPVPPILLADAHEAVVSTLLAKGAREPTLAKAVAAGAPNAVARLVGKGASASSKTADGEPVLLVAVRDSGGAKRRAMVEVLLKAGADVNAKHDDETALSLALVRATSHAEESEKEGDRAADIVTKLVARGAKVDGDALLTAMRADEDKRAGLLDVLLAGTLDRAATIRAVAFAADNHDVASLEKIAGKGVAWTALDARAVPPLASAIVASDVTMVKALLRAGAPTDRMGEDGDTALLAAVAAAAGESEDAVRVVRVLLDQGASPNKRGRDGRTALFAAAQQGTESLVTLLVSKGARVDDGVDGMTPLEAADARGHEGVVKLLEARGATVKKKKKAAPRD